MHEQDQEHHVLIVIDEKGRHAIALDAATYSLGRDATNAIVLDSPTVSRQHAILLRVPIPQTNRYHYQLIDGNAKGKPSANGVFVNDQRCSTRELANGDVISFGEKVSASYQIVAMVGAESANYIESASFKSVKSEAVDPKATIVGLDLADELAQVNLPEPQDPRSTMTADKTEKAAPSFNWLWIGGGVTIIGIAAAGWVWASNRTPTTPPPQRSEPTSTSLSNSSAS